MPYVTALPSVWAMTPTDTTRAVLEGRRALVTGAASGIGAAVAARLAASGAEVHLLDRDEEGVAKVAAQVHGVREALRKELGDGRLARRHDAGDDDDLRVVDGGGEGPVAHVAPP